MKKLIFLNLFLAVVITASATITWMGNHTKSTQPTNSQTIHFYVEMWDADNNYDNCIAEVVINEGGNWVAYALSRGNNIGNNSTWSANIVVKSSASAYYLHGWEPGKDVYDSNDSKNYSISINPTTAQAGNWNDAGSWCDGVVPASTSASFVIAHNLTLNTNVTVGTLTINSGVTFTASDASDRVLTISKSASGSSVTLANDGTWATGDGESTVIFTGAPSSVDAVHSITGAIAFDKVVINKSGGSSNVGAGFEANSSVSASLEIGEGGYVSTDPPASFYGSNAVLIFNQGTGATYNINPGDKTWSTTVVPNSITINSGAVVVNENRSADGVVSVASGAVLEVGAVKQLTVDTLINNGTFTVKSGATVIPTVVQGTGTNNVEQYLASGRQWWYLASPLSNATSNVFRPAASSNLMGGYSEPGFNYTSPFAAGSSTPLVPGKGYAVKLAFTTGNTYTFTGGSLITAEVSPSVTRSGIDHAKRGFNLVGNPFTAYLDWDMVMIDAVNVRNAIWFRTKGASEMVFHTYSDGDGVPFEANITGLIAPMQAFWVKVDTDPVSPALVSNGTLLFKPTFRKHASTGGNPLKVKATDARPRLRLVVSNGTAFDETLIVGKSYASNGHDAFDVEKMSNDNVAIPEIYSIVENQEMVINSMNSLSAGTAVKLGFRPGMAGSYKLEVSQLENIDARVMLVDKLTNTETELSAGITYSLLSDANVTNDRFSIEFRAPGAVTAIDELAAEQLTVWSDASGNLNVQSEAITADDQIRVYTLAGQLLTQQLAEGQLTVLKHILAPGVYLVNVKNATSKVIIN